MGRAVSKDIRAFKRAYREKPCIKDAAIAAGYAQTGAKQGLAAMPKQIRSFVLAKQRKLDKMMRLAQTVTPEAQELIARGGILSNIAEGKDRAVQSLKLAGQDKRVAMFTPDSMTGVIIISHPPTLPALPARSLPAICIPSASD